MTELSDREEQLMSLSTRDLAVMYRDLPTGKVARNWGEMDELSEEGVIKLSDWVEEQIPEIINNNVRPEVVEQMVTDMEVELANRASTGHAWIKYSSVYMRGKIWMAEVMRWKALMLNDEDNAEIYYPSLKENLNLASRLLMVSDIFAGKRDIEMTEIIKTNLRVLDLRDIADDLEIYQGVRGEYGRAKPFLN